MPNASCRTRHDAYRAASPPNIGESEGPRRLACSVKVEEEKNASIVLQTRTVPNQLKQTDGEEEANGRTTLLQAVNVADDARAHGHTTPATERLHDAEEHQLRDGTREGNAQRAQGEYGEDGEIDGSSAICGDGNDMFG